MVPTFGTYNPTILSDITILASFTHQPTPPPPVREGGSDHGDNSYPIDAFGASRTRGWAGITAVLLPAGTFGSVLFTELPSNIAPPTSGRYQTGFISVPSYPGNHALFEFSVPSAILSDQGRSVHDVALLLYYGSSWGPQKTYYIGEKRGGVNGFGSFALSYMVYGAEVIAKSTPEPFDPSAVQTKTTPSPAKTPEASRTAPPADPSSKPTAVECIDDDDTDDLDSSTHLQMADTPLLGAFAGLDAVVFLLRKRR